MSATESPPSPPPGQGSEHLAQEAHDSPTSTTDLPQPHDDPSTENKHQSAVSTEVMDEPQVSGDQADASQDPSSHSQESPSVPSQPKSLEGQLDGLSISEANTSKPQQLTEVPTPPAPTPPEKDEAFTTSNPPTLAPLQTVDPIPVPSSDKELPEVPGDSDPESKQTKSRRDEPESQMEIQTIMGQFQDPARTTDQDQIMSPRLELATQNYFPHRRSSLEHANSPAPGPSSASPQGALSSSPITTHSRKSMGPEEPMLTRRSSSSTIPPLPEPEPDQPFDFHRFLEQLRHRTADPVAKFLRSFLMEFGKKQWMVHEQVKIISDFLAFITNKMAICEVWRDVSDSEFDNAKEGMEKLVMNRLYSQTFAPAIPAPPTIPRSASRSRRREIERLHGPWRRGQHQEDIERDDILAQKIRIYGWVSEEHLDIPPVHGSGRRFLNLAQQGMLIHYIDCARNLLTKTPRTVED